VSDLAWVCAMHGGTLTRDFLPQYVYVLREQPFAHPMHLAWTRGGSVSRQLRTPVTGTERAATAGSKDEQRKVVMLGGAQHTSQRNGRDGIEPPTTCL
jgi:hypothetical protein